jgi:hypothetical protein
MVFIVFIGMRMTCPTIVACRSARREQFPVLHGIQGSCGPSARLDAQIPASGKKGGALQDDQTSH